MVCLLREENAGKLIRDSNEVKYIIANFCSSDSRFDQCKSRYYQVEQLRKTFVYKGAMAAVSDSLHSAETLSSGK